MNTNKTAAELSEDEITRLAKNIEVRRKIVRQAQITKSRTDRVRQQLTAGEVELRNAVSLNYLLVHTLRDGRVQDQTTMYIPAALIPEVLDFLSNKLEEIANG